jgi:DNA-binding NarL/FixJ family response regulator
VAEALPGEDKVILETGSVDGVHRLARDAGDIDLVLLDLNMPGMDGLAGLAGLRHACPSLPIVIVSATEEPATVREAIACGAAGFVPKSLGKAEIAHALGCVLAGEVYLPPGMETAQDAEAGGPAGPDMARRIAALAPQQLSVLRLIAQGKPNKIIAHELGIAEATVKAHVTVVLRKLGVFSRTQAVVAARSFFAGK